MCLLPLLTTYTLFLFPSFLFYPEPELPGAQRLQAWSHASSLSSHPSHPSCLWGHAISGCSYTTAIWEPQRRIGTWWKLCKAYWRFMANTQRIEGLHKKYVVKLHKKHRAPRLSRIWKHCNRELYSLYWFIFIEISVVSCRCGGYAVEYICFIFMRVIYCKHTCPCGISPFAFQIIQGSEAKWYE